MTKRFALLLSCLLFVTISIDTAASIHEAYAGKQRVGGYTRKNGTYVKPYWRSTPDKNPTNNWSYPGNVNPMTGERATGNVSVYLRNLYGPDGQPTNQVAETQEPRKSQEGSSASFSLNGSTTTFNTEVVAMTASMTSTRPREYRSLRLPKQVVVYGAMTGSSFAISQIAR